MNFAPYSHIARPKGNGIFVLAGPGAMQQAEIRNSRGMAALAYTGNTPANSLRWPVMGFAITVINMGLEDQCIESLVHTLLRSGAALIVVISKSDIGASVHRQEVQSDAA